jgi:tight adherence protein C
MQVFMYAFLLILASLLAGGAVASVVFASYDLMVGKTLKKRLRRIARPGRAPDESSFARVIRSHKVASVISLLSRLSIPEEGWQNSSLQLRFLQAGIRNKKAPVYYFAVKTLLTLVLPVAAGLLLHVVQPNLPVTRIMFWMVPAAAAGYYLPELLLRYITRERIERMRDSLPDMIDLMVICAESGMSLDSATARISREMVRTSPDLAQEFHLSALEMRAGASRIEALRNLALRARLEDLGDLVSMLVQADKFGTSLAESLRVQADMMRSRRAQRAEEHAAKIPVKMLLPLVLFIFPTLIMVLVGPAVIQIMEAFSN